MDLYRGSFSTFKPAILQHFGSAAAAAHRIESICTHKAQFAIRNGAAVQIDHTGAPLRTCSLEDMLETFADTLSPSTITKHSLNFSSPLTLTDCWGDDPIGSGAMDIFNAASGLSTRQQRELEKIFSPFTHVIYPDIIPVQLSSLDVKALEKEGRKNAYYAELMADRKTRSTHIGEDFLSSLPQEIVWTTLTLRLRSWALQNGFDSFSYDNTSEGHGEKSYVTLQSNQATKPVAELLFDKDFYLQTVCPDFMREFLAYANSPADSAIRKTHPMWAGHPPEMFWIEKSPK